MLQKTGEITMPKKLLALFLVLTCAASAITGCSSSKNRVVNEDNQIDQEIVTITFFGNKYEPENVIVIEQIISDFMRENPSVRVSYESLKGNDYFEALEKRMEHGRGDDIFMVNHDVLLKLEADGQVADLSGLSTLPDFTDEMRSQMGEGKITWVPTNVSIFGLYCNLDLLKEHKQEVPGTLSEWEAVCEYFVNCGITPVIANNDISLKALAIGRGFWQVYQDKRQTEVFGQLNHGRETLSEYLTDGFSIVETFIRRGYLDAEKTLNTKKTSDDLDDFIRGESPFLLTGAWAAGRVAGMEPDFRFEVAPLPILDEGSMLVINPDTRLSINAQSDHFEAAMKFVEYFTKAENIQKFADQQSSFSPLKGGSPSSVLEIQPLIACYESGQTVIGTDDLLKLPIWELTAEVSRKLLAGEELESAMSWLDQQAQERIVP